MPKQVATVGAASGVGLAVFVFNRWRRWLSVLDNIVALGAGAGQPCSKLYGPVDDKMMAVMAQCRKQFDSVCNMLYSLYIPASMRVGVTQHEVKVGRHQTRVVVFVPPTAQQRQTDPPLLLYYHSGGLIIGSPEAEASWSAAFAAQLGVVVASIDYRMAPEHTFPISFEDCVEAAESILSDAQSLGTPFDSTKVVAYGYSAGGLMASVVALSLAEKNIAMAGHVVHAPWLAPFDTPSRVEFFETNVGWVGKDDIWAWQRYLAGVDPASYDWRISPLFASDEMLAKTSPCYVSYCAYDTCRSGAELYLDKLRKVGKVAGEKAHPCSHLSVTSLSDIVQTTIRAVGQLLLEAGAVIPPAVSSRL